MSIFYKDNGILRNVSKDTENINNGGGGILLSDLEYRSGDFIEQSGKYCISLSSTDANLLKNATNFVQAFSIDLDSNNHLNRMNYKYKLDKRYASITICIKIYGGKVQNSNDNIYDGQQFTVFHNHITSAYLNMNNFTATENSGRIIFKFNKENNLLSLFLYNDILLTNRIIAFHTLSSMGEYSKPPKFFGLAYKNQ